MDGYIYRIGSTTNIIGRPPRFYRSNELGSLGLAFCSVYAVREEDAKAISEAAGTAAGFKGSVWSQRLWMDFDTAESAEDAKRRLRDMGVDHVVYTTGNRGLHIGVLREAQPSHTLPMQDRDWVRANFPGADMSLYWHLHLLRLPGAVHEVTGLSKRLLYRVEGRSVTLPKIEPETMRVSETPASNRPGIFTLWAVSENLTGVSPEGRHKQLVNLAIALRRDARVTIDECRWVMGEVNRGFPEPKPVEEVNRIVEWAYDQRQ